MQPVARTCRICLQRLSPSLRTCPSRTRPYSNNARAEPSDDSSAPNPNASPPSDPPQGAMSRLLEQATEDALLTGGRAGYRAIQDAGFSEELKARLLEKIADADFRSTHADAMSAAELSSAMGRGTRGLAADQPWTGDEPTVDAVLRMLDDAHKPLPPGLRGRPTAAKGVVVDMRLRRDPARSAGEKLEAARERAAAYAGLSGDERAAVKAELRERFTPGARAMPNTMSGLAALANERIENAIARGQFKNIPRGKGVVSRDGRADNPFIDTTEYIMNNMIKRQDMVPPWIEKQQELTRAARTFRQRMRNDWQRHAARCIASAGGSLQDQIRRAEGYARAEVARNPRMRNVDQIAVSTSSTDDPVMAKMHEQQEKLVAALDEEVRHSVAEPGHEESAQERPKEEDMTPTHVFRDSAWESAERSYMELSVTNLNAITRSYNLMAPDLAKKPYFSLQRELDACYADVAPMIAETILERARAPAKTGEDVVVGGRAGNMLRRLGADDWTTTVKIYDSKTPNYGLLEMWRDLWAKKKT